MLLPFDFAVLTKEEAKLLKEFIEKMTATKNNTRNYEKMQKLGIMLIYDKLREFVESSDHYQHSIRNLDTSRLVTEDY